MKEKRNLNVTFTTSGSGSKTTRLSIPISIIRDMGVSEDDRQVEVTYDKVEKIITIKKK
ncbi:MAG: AbrB/MazE/SpoVT family DNA-binding domain-containing protein [Paeniclostridium sp.]|nr:AbrB/MazE/SpoVT family DNA-binding domain-containing protein [Paeniclostridium sp.]MBW4861755.1 AbrB/MazE/SpoVT family DNA-binding domain-containing protein [Paeniclostridium sp.]MBW4873406.1 AbrB/MazE/SpoVT family DNA-binding domain-containing protein [Paeniclostridium sp.]